MTVTQFKTQASRCLFRSRETTLDVTSMSTCLFHKNNNNNNSKDNNNNIVMKNGTSQKLNSPAAKKSNPMRNFPEKTKTVWFQVEAAWPRPLLIHQDQPRHLFLHFGRTTTPTWPGFPTFQSRTRSKLEDTFNSGLETADTLTAVLTSPSAWVTRTTTRTITT